MINYSAEPTTENVYKALKDNIIGRNKFIVKFIKLIYAVDDCCSIALDGDWGNGKTFFIKQTKLILDCFNEFSAIDSETREQVKSIMNQFELPNEEIYSTVYYDAFANDNDIDPILSIIYTAIESNQSSYNPEDKINLINTGAAIATIITGRNITNLFDKAKGNDPLDSISNGENIKQLFNNFINNMIEERGNKLVIFIDELDRCSPSYAVQLLERIKHYFNDDRIIFVFSVCLSQLHHTIRCYYGNEFDSTKYLDKFFDLRLSLPNIDYDSFLRLKFERYSSEDIYDDICIHVIKHFHFSLRETERYLRLIRIAVNQDRVSKIPSYKDGMAKVFSIIYIVPIMIGLSMVNIHQYKEFINGNAPVHLYAILQKTNMYSLGKFILNQNECYEKEGDSDIEVIFEERIDDIYKALFTHPYLNNETIPVGPLQFSLETRNNIYDIVTLLSSFADFDLK